MRCPLGLCLNPRPGSGTSGACAQRVAAPRSARTSHPRRRLGAGTLAVKAHSPPGPSAPPIPRAQPRSGRRSPARNAHTRLRLRRARPRPQVESRPSSALRLVSENASADCGPRGARARVPGPVRQTPIEHLLRRSIQRASAERCFRVVASPARHPRGNRSGPWLSA